MEKQYVRREEHEETKLICDFCGKDIEDYTIRGDSRQNGIPYAISFGKIDIHYQCFEQVMKQAKKPR